MYESLLSKITFQACAVHYLWITLLITGFETDWIGSILIIVKHFSFFKRKSISFGKIFMPRKIVENERLFTMGYKGKHFAGNICHLFSLFIFSGIFLFNILT